MSSDFYAVHEAGGLADPGTSSIIAVMEAVQAGAPGLTPTQLLIFLRVAAEEGIRLNVLGARTNENQASISRNVALLTATGHVGSGRSGHDLLVLLRDRDDGRGRRAALTDKGRRLLGAIHHALQS